MISSWYSLEDFFCRLAGGATTDANQVRKFHYGGTGLYPGFHQATRHEAVIGADCRLSRDDTRLLSVSLLFGDGG